MVIGPLLIQWGHQATNSGGTFVTFARPFAASSTPMVSVNLNDPGTQDPRIYNISNTGMTVRQSYASANLDCQWIAIGKA